MAQKTDTIYYMRRAETTGGEKDGYNILIANKVCRHTLLSALSNDLFDVYCSYKESKEIWDSLILKYTTEDVIKQRFIIANYYHWTIINFYIKVQINEYHKLLEDLKTKNISLPDEFVSELLIEKLLES
uniref:Uncharacterized protein n=1 Tax=Glycine max TaxID=3847 RepID=A0A0R0HJF1_SOYBN